MGTAVATAALGLGLALSPAQAVTIGFVGVNADQQNLSNQLFVDVTQVGGAGSNIQFVFSNLVGIASNVSEVYFDWVPNNLFSGIVSIAGNNAGLNFVPGANPANLPEGNNIAFVANGASEIEPAPKRHQRLGGSAHHRS